MSMNKFMHSRNIYKIPPNFKQLALNYPEFRKFAKTELSGKVVIDFKDQAAVRALTCTLLEKDFGLNVEIPLDRLVPTLPLRLNYLLWIEDLLDVLKLGGDIKGIDIGTGASCIYPLLAAKQNNWKMIATEVDAESAECALRNVIKNNLEGLISVRKVEAPQLLLGVIDEGVSYNFTMCNPPFFSSEDELDSVSKGRSPSRTPPANGFTGSLGEVVVQGGEVAFVKRIIAESKQIGQQIMLYTSMLGHKRNVSVLMEELSAAGVSSTCRTEFCQGNTTRWGVAWTFCQGVVLPNPSHQLVPNKKLQLPMTYIVPKDTPGLDYTIKGVMQRVKEILCQLQMVLKSLKHTKYLIAVQATAYTNTWSKQRRKRREEKLDKPENGREESPSCKKFRLHSGAESQEAQVVQQSTQTGQHSVLVEPSAMPVEQTLVTANEKLCVDQPSAPQQGLCLLQTQLVVRSIADEVHLELTWSGGTSGRDTLHQVLQFIKNHLRS